MAKKIDKNKLEEYVNKLIAPSPLKATWDAKYVYNKLKKGMRFHEIVGGVDIPKKYVKPVYDYIVDNNLEEKLYGDVLYKGSTYYKQDKPVKEDGLKDFLGPKDSDQRQKIKDAQDVRSQKQEEEEEEEEKEPEKDEECDKPGEEEEKECPEGFKGKMKRVCGKDGKWGEWDKTTCEPEDEDKEEEEEEEEKEPEKEGEKAEAEKPEGVEKGAEGAGEAVETAGEAGAVGGAGAGAAAAGGAAGSAAAAGGTAAATGGAAAAGGAAVASGPVIVIIVVIIAVIGAIAAFLIYTYGGKHGLETAKALENRGNIQLPPSMSKNEELKKALAENIDEFIKKIENIKKSATGKNKDEIIKLCDEILKDANDLKSKSEEQKLKTEGVEAEEREASAKIKGEKTTLTQKIRDNIDKLSKLLIVAGDVPCLAEPSASYCGQTSVMMVVCAFNPLCGISNASTVEDYRKKGSTSSGSGLIPLITQNIPGNTVVQVNQIKGSTPEYNSLYNQAIIGNPVVIGTQFPGQDNYPHYMVVTGFAGKNEKGENTYYVNNPYFSAGKGGCEKIVLSESYFRTHPYPGNDYWYMYMSNPLKQK